MFRTTDICAAKSEETKAFAEEYSANMFDDDAEFAHLKEDRMEVDLDDDEESEDEANGTGSGDEEMHGVETEYRSWFECGSGSCDTELGLKPPLFYRFQFTSMHTVVCSHKIFSLYFCASQVTVSFSP